VAAYVVQAVETLVGLQETAVVRVAGGWTEPIADATQDVDVDTIARLVREMRGQAPREVVVYDEEPPVALPPSVTTVVAALIHDDVDGAIAVVAPWAEEGAVAETDRELLELVLGHAAATIRSLVAGYDPHHWPVRCLSGSRSLTPRFAG